MKSPISAVSKASVCGVLPTYNRRRMLEKALEAVGRQERRPEHLLIVNNASNDSTREFLNGYILDKSWITVVEVEVNCGSAGAFNLGVRWAFINEFDLIWTLDDDAYPKPNALSELLEFVSPLEKWGFVCSYVCGQEGFAMQVPHISSESNSRGFPAWPENLSRGAVQVDAATWISLLFRADSVGVIGLPRKEFFMWAEDIDFSKRLTKVGPSYLVGQSVVVHDKPIAIGNGIINENNSTRLRYHYYFYRNLTFMRRVSGFKMIFLSSLRTAVTCIDCIRFSPDRKLLRAMIVVRGWLSGLIFNPAVERVNRGKSSS